MRLSTLTVGATFLMTSLLGACSGAPDDPTPAVEQEDPGAAVAAEELGQFWADRIMERARSALARRRSWPPEWQHSGLPTESQFILYITPDEAREMLSLKGGDAVNF